MKSIVGELPELLTIQEAARIMHVHPNTLRKWEKQGRIKAIRIGSRRDRRFSKQVLWKFFNRDLK